MSESYPCRGWCGLGGTQPDDNQRQILRCALPGFHDSRWRDEPTPRRYMGRLPIYGQAEPEDDILEGEDPEHPKDSHEEGCPGAWYRCAFVRSLQKYERLLLGDNFQSNLLANRCEDRLVLEALQFIESERVRARAYWNLEREKHNAKSRERE